MVIVPGVAAISVVTLCVEEITTLAPLGGTLLPAQVDDVPQLPVCEDTNPRKVKLLVLEAEQSGLVLTVITPVEPAPTPSVADAPDCESIVAAVPPTDALVKPVKPVPLIVITSPA